MSEAAIDQQGPSKLLGLEIIRFSCAIAVLVWHFRHFALIGDGRLMLTPHMPLEWLFYPFYHFGLFGVQIFWCISGFIFYWKYADALSARRVDARHFFWLRFSRLYPLHFVTLLIVAVFQLMYSASAGQPFIYDDVGPLRFALHIFLADQWAGAHDLSFNGPIWSVSAEVLVYIAFFLLLSTFGKSRWLIAGAIAAGMAALWSGANSPALICGSYFFAGGAAAEAFRDKTRRRAWSWSAFGTLALGMVAAPFLNLGDQGGERLSTWLLLMTPPLLFVAAQDMRPLERCQNMIQAAGNLTYSIYLIHFPLQLITVTALLALDMAPPVGEAWFLVFYLTASIVIGRIVFVRFEAPMQRMIRAATLAKANQPAMA